MPRLTPASALALSLVAAACLAAACGDSDSDTAHDASGQPSPASAGSAGASGKGGSTASGGASASLPTGDLFEEGFDKKHKPLLDASPSGDVSLSVSYPLAGALFPRNIAPEIHVKRPSKDLSFARVTFSVGKTFTTSFYGVCLGLSETACVISLPAPLCSSLAEAGELGPLETRVRLATDDGKSLGETSIDGLAWAPVSLEGGLYYWTTFRGDDGQDRTAIKRYDFKGKGTKPEIYWTNDDSPSLATGQERPCAGCHAISSDGTRMALTFGGSDPSNFALIDVAKKSPIAIRNSEPEGPITMSTFSPDGKRMVTSFRGALTLRGTDMSLAAMGELFGDATSEAKTHPFWSLTGGSFAFVSWAPGEHGASGSRNGDVQRGAQIWVAPAGPGSPMGSPRLRVPRASGESSYYPALSDDDALLVFNRSSCDGPGTTQGYGEDPCDGYDDPSARLLVASVAGDEPPVELSRVNGQGTITNSWPRFGPSHGTFRGKSLYFVAFSSKRAYGERYPGSTDGNSKPQLWFAALLLDPSAPVTSDPSFAPVWLPGQNSDPESPTGNHVPQWTTTAVEIIK